MRELSEVAVSPSEGAPARALYELGGILRELGYRFVTVTPETHRRVLARCPAHNCQEAHDLRDVFGWNLPFRPDRVPEAILRYLIEAGALAIDGALCKSHVRFATLSDRLFVHSAFPTEAPDAVFFGPDTYRFAALLQRWAPAGARSVVDIGCGSGAGGILLAGGGRHITLADVNLRALEFASINAEINGVDVRVIESDVLNAIPLQHDLIIANPPYMRDRAGRLYRDGGGVLGEGLALRIVREALPKLADGGTLIVYTGSPIVRGVDTFFEAVRAELAAGQFEVLYEELDPDVFGEELEGSEYGEVDRIAVVGLRVHCTG